MKISRMFSQSQCSVLTKHMGHYSRHPAHNDRTRWPRSSPEPQWVWSHHSSWLNCQRTNAAVLQTSVTPRYNITGSAVVSRVSIRQHLGWPMRRPDPSSRQTWHYQFAGRSHIGVPRILQWMGFTWWKPGPMGLGDEVPRRWSKMSHQCTIFKVFLHKI